jgi:LysR family glycine cleavage system transcriptional activator
MSLSPRRPKGPHLNSLRAFEAAARLQSFAAAADELSVTPGAVTQHVKTLEAWAGTALFTRNARGITLTPLAEELLPQFTDAFDKLGSAVHSLRSKAHPERIRIAALPSIAQLWLAPRLGKLRRIATEASVSVVALETPPNLAREPFDISLFYSETPPGEFGLTVSDDIIFPVCSPSVASRLNTIDDLQNETLLHDGSWRDDWEKWLKSQGAAHAAPKSGTVHSLFSVALEEARHGGGVLMAHELLVQDFLKEGVLVQPFEATLTLPRKLTAKFTPAFSRSPVFSKVKQILADGE